MSKPLTPQEMVTKLDGIAQGNEQIINQFYNWHKGKTTMEDLMGATDPAILELVRACRLAMYPLTSAEVKVFTQSVESLLQKVRPVTVTTLENGEQALSIQSDSGLTRKTYKLDRQTGQWSDAANNIIPDEQQLKYTKMYIDALIQLKQLPENMDSVKALVPDSIPEGKAALRNLYFLVRDGRIYFHGEVSDSGNAAGHLRLSNKTWGRYSITNLLPGQKIKIKYHATSPDQPLLNLLLIHNLESLATPTPPTPTTPTTPEGGTPTEGETVETPPEFRTLSIPEGIFQESPSELYATISETPSRGAEASNQEGLGLNQPMEAKRVVMGPDETSA
jgi:hypothetical protein